MKMPRYKFKYIIYYWAESFYIKIVVFWGRDVLFEKNVQFITWESNNKPSKQATIKGQETVIFWTLQMEAVSSPPPPPKNSELIAEQTASLFIVIYLITLNTD
jgi:hypothetical protein